MVRSKQTLPRNVTIRDDRFASVLAVDDGFLQPAPSGTVAVDPPVLPVPTGNAMLGALPPAAACPHAMKAGAGRACESLYLYLEQPGSSVRTFATACWRTEVR